MAWDAALTLTSVPSLMKDSTRLGAIPCIGKLGIFLGPVIAMKLAEALGWIVAQFKVPMQVSKGPLHNTCIMAWIQDGSGEEGLCSWYRIPRRGQRIGRVLAGTPPFQYPRQWGEIKL